MNPFPLRLGLIGSGSFGQFCLRQYRDMADIVPVAVTDTLPEPAKYSAERFGLKVIASPEQMLKSPDVDLIHIATPSSSHYELAATALKHGKHVLCEKPLAVRMEDAMELTRLARENQRLLAVNLLIRYAPLCSIVQTILEEDLLGAPMHAFFENYAKDEQLSPEHWFWNWSMSGGIFIEQGVHFFDLFRMWFGDGVVTAAHKTKRPGTIIIEQAQCTALYGDHVIVNFYHGFYQAPRMDRQEFRIVCERGDIRMSEWFPAVIAIDGIMTRRQCDRLMELIPDAALEIKEEYKDEFRHVRSRHREHVVDGRYRITGEDAQPKMDLYGQALRALLQDQIQAIRDPTHVRKVSEENGIISLKMAVDAEHLANAHG